jgi:hypothetical protein
MRDQLRAIDAKLGTLDAPLSCFNIRFRPANFERYEPFRVAAAGDSINKISRYTLIPADTQVVETEWRRRVGSNEPPTIRTVTRSGHQGVTYDPIEKALQGELLRLLQDKFGKKNVTREADFIDLTVIDGAKKLLVEIKSDGDARLAIRKALGQVLEYAYFNSGSENANVHLIIIAPGPVTPRVAQYVKLLKEQFGIPVSYASFSSGGALPSVF